MAVGDWDVVVIGGGAAGLAAALELQHAGQRVLCLEARARAGGRIATVHDPLSPVPIELGPEFVHGRPREIWDIIRAEPLTVYDTAGRAVRIREGQADQSQDAWELVGDVMHEMQRAAERGPDRSFAEFLAGSQHSEQTKRLVVSYVEGFNAARQQVVGIASLAQDARAADEIDGNRSFRILNGYDAVPLHFLRALRQAGCKIETNSVVYRIDWEPGKVRVHFRRGLNEGATELVHGDRAVVTVPLGVLQAVAGDPGAIAFAPEPADVLAAVSKLRFGQVVRVVLRFREPFWEEKDEIADAGFLLSCERHFPTWWTTLPVRAPVLTGWSAGPHADDLLGLTPAEVASRAIDDLGRITGFPSERLNCLVAEAYTHDWVRDPFARGAYSYVPAGALPARETLATPVKDTLYFAGEATELEGHSATVHGAIASGRRAAGAIMEAVTASLPHTRVQRNAQP